MWLEKAGAVAGAARWTGQGCSWCAEAMGATGCGNLARARDGTQSTHRCCVDGTWQVVLH